MKQTDTRDVNAAPSTYTNQSAVLEFKKNSTIGISNESTFSGLLTYKIWSTVAQNGGLPHQIAFTMGGHLYHRYAANDSTWGAWKKILTKDDITPSGQIIEAIPLTASAISASSSSAICAITNRSYTLNGTEAYINVQCVLSSGVSLAGNDWWRLVRDFPMPKGATASTTDMGVSLNAVLYQSNGDYAGQVDAHIAYHTAETNRPAGWYLRVHTNVQLTAGMKVIASGSYLI